MANSKVSRSTSPLIQSLNNGDLTPNEFAVLVAGQALANGSKTLTASTTALSKVLNGLSRHAVARALRNLENEGWLTWDTNGGSSSKIVFNN